MFRRLDITSKILLVLCMIVMLLSVRFIWNKENWSPIDEYAHMDYIQKLSEGRLPILSDTVTRELFLHIKNNPQRSLLPPISTREELGIGNISYEAGHPPIYYSILLLPEFIMQKCEMDIFARLKILRLFSYLLFVIGMFLCIPLFNKLSQLGFSIPAWYAYGCVFFGLLIATHQRYGLGNNMLSPLIINLTIIQLLNYWLEPSDKKGIRFILFSCISVFVALSNVFVLPVLYLFFFLKFRKHFSMKILLYSLFIIAVTGLLFFFWKYNTKPDPAVYDLLQFFLNIYIPAGFVDYKTFLAFLTEDTFNFSFLIEDFDTTYFFMSLFFLNLIIGFIFIKDIWLKHKWVFGFAIALILLVVITFILNRYVARVHWVGFRHYLGFIPAVYVACTAFIVILKSKFKGGSRA